MMHFLRGRVAKIIFGVLLVAFLGWIVAELGMYGRIGSPRSEVATVNGEAISAQEFGMLYNQEMEVTWRQLRSSLTEADEHRLRRDILERLIDQTLLWQEAKRLDCAVSAEIAQASIRAMPTFRNAEGAFDPVRYQAVLGRLGIPPQAFEIQQERSLSVARLESFLQQGVRCTDLELWLEYLRWHRQMSGELMSFPLDEARKKINVSEDEVREHWAQNRQLYERPERVRIRHIWISARPEGGPDAAAQAQAQAQSILDEIRAGGDFSEIARAKSNDSNTAARGGDLGWHSRGNLIPEYENVVFKLRDGEISGLVQVPQGFSIIRCDRHEKEQKPAYEDIRSKIRGELRDARARSEMGQEAYRAGWYLGGDDKGDIEGVGERIGRTPRKTGWFEWGKKPPLGLSKATFEGLMEHIAGLEPGETTQVVEAGDGFYIFKLVEERHLRAPQAGFLEERDTIEPVLLRRKRRTAMSAWLKSIKERAKIKASL